MIGVLYIIIYSAIHNVYYEKIHVVRYLNQTNDINCIINAAHKIFTHIDKSNIINGINCMGHVSLRHKTKALTFELC